MPEIVIREGYVAGAIGRVAELHARYYHEHWGFGVFFEAKVASELSEFMERYDNARDGFWVAMQNGRIEGSLTIDGLDADTHGAHLRWYIVSDVNRGRGIGRRLLDEAMRFCRRRRYNRVFLWTFEGLHPARHLYEQAGFQLVEEHPGRQWGKKVNEQRFELQWQGTASSVSGNTTD